MHLHLTLRARFIPRLGHGKAAGPFPQRGFPVRFDSGHAPGISLLLSTLGVNTSLGIAYLATYRAQADRLVVAQRERFRFFGVHGNRLETRTIREPNSDSEVTARSRINSLFGRQVLSW